MSGLAKGAAGCQPNEQCRRHAGQHTVVTFPQPLIVVDRDVSVREGELRGLNRTGKLRGDHRGDTVVPASLAKLPR